MGHTKSNGKAYPSIPSFLHSVIPSFRLKSHQAYSHIREQPSQQRVAFMNKQLKTLNNYLSCFIDLNNGKYSSTLSNNYESFSNIFLISDVLQFLDKNF
ncbi:hypothetical protein pb186bvf_005055, partial [Paramecium bursaria]